jgi:hypothetical protein
MIYLMINPSAHDLIKDLRHGLDEMDSKNIVKYQNITEKLLQQIKPNYIVFKFNL